MITTLKLGAFVDSLCKKRLTSMNELRRYAASSIHMEELSEFHDRVRGDKKKKLDSIKEKLKPVKEKVSKDGHDSRSMQHIPFSLKPEHASWKKHSTRKYLHYHYWRTLIVKSTIPNNADTTRTMVIQQKNALL